MPTYLVEFVCLHSTSSSWDSTWSSDVCAMYLNTMWYGWAMELHTDRYRSSHHKWAARISSNTCHYCPHSYRISGKRQQQRTCIRSENRNEMKSVDGSGSWIDGGIWLWMWVYVLWELFFGVFIFDESLGKWRDAHKRCEWRCHWCEFWQEGNWE